MAGSVPLSALADVLRPGDRVLVGQATAEPIGLVAALFELAPRLDDLEVFCGLSLNPAWAQAVPDALGVATYCGVGTLGALVTRGRARVMPCSLSQLTAWIAARQLRVDVVLLQVSPADEQGYHSPACAIDYAWDAVKTARAVVVEVNHSVPAIRCATRIHTSDVVIAGHTHAPLPQSIDTAPAEVHGQVAAQVARLVPDGATIQLGIGALAVAVARALRSRRGLKVRSGMVGDWLLELLDAGAIDTQTPQACLASLAVGSQALYGTIGVDGPLGFAPPSELVQPLPGSPFMAINSAIEVDLCGQVNSEFLGSRYVGTVGGQPDYFRAARRSVGGLAVLALPATSGGDAQSRIVPRLAGAYVSTAQSDVDVIVTENGAADLRATDFDQRQRRIAGIADVRVREALARGPLT
jgi:acyl-CoA hydrolase